MSKTFTFRVDAIETIDPELGTDNEYFDPEWDVKYSKVHFTMIEGFEARYIIVTQLRVGLNDVESQSVGGVNYSSSDRIGSYEVSKSESKLSVGQTYTSEIRTQLHLADSKEEILKQLEADPSGLMIEFYPWSAWITQDINDDDPVRNPDEHDELVPDVCLVADLIKSGNLELDGRGVVKLKGYANRAIEGSEWWCQGVVGVDLTIDDCIEMIDAQGKAIARSLSN